MEAEPSTLPVAVIGTAGHIDHGKSALVRALTGIDPDRLPEEKRRGITIQLGYAFLDLPSGRRVSIVDVPGHERFVKTMAQGASVIQAGMFVVDAGEGIKPQSVEHLHILQSMGLKRGVVALTKCDAAPDDIQELAEEEVRELAAGTFLEDARIIRTSAVSGLGLDELRAELDRLVAGLGEDLRALPLRIPVDRVFSVTGFGTVVTGTLLGGRIREGDEVLVQPPGRKAKVRGLEVHDVRVAEAAAPCRIALNLSGLDSALDIKGRWITAPDVFRDTRSLLVLVMGMPWVRKEIRVPARLSLNLGSGIFSCRLFARQGIRIGRRVLGRLSLDQPVIARSMDRFVLRLPGGASGGYATVAGGLVIDPLFYGRKIEGRLEETYGSAESMTEEELLQAAIRLAGRRGVESRDLALKAPGPPRQLEKLLGRLASSGKMVRVRDRVFDGALFDEAAAAAAAALDAFHAKQPERAGARRDEILHSMKPPLPRPLFDAVAERLVRKGAWALAGDQLRRADFSPTGDAVTDKVSAGILAILSKNPSSPPSLKELAAMTGESGGNVQRAVQLLSASGRARLVDGEFLYTTEFLDRFVEAVETFFKTHEELRITDLKALAGVSRKYALPLARWLDDRGVTLRRGEVRTRRKG
jgi:selenocysteine-specific elongation factor